MNLLKYAWISLLQTLYFVWIGGIKLSLDFQIFWFGIYSIIFLYAYDGRIVCFWRSCLLFHQTNKRMYHHDWLTIWCCGAIHMKMCMRKNNYDPTWLEIKHGCQGKIMLSDWSIFKNLLVRNYLADLIDLWYEWSMDGPLPKLGIIRKILCFR